VTRLGVTRNECLADLDRRRNLPGKKLARQRLLGC